MNQGFLSQYFVSVAAKKLSAVESDLDKSNQHEFNGSKELKHVLGTDSSDPIRFPVNFIWLGQENEGISIEGSVTWYDARQNHPTRSEYRLYFPTNEVMSLAQAGDSMFIAKRTDDSLLIIITPSNSTVEGQLLWLFGLPRQTSIQFTLQDIEQDHDIEVDFACRFILDELGVEVEEPETELLDRILGQFRGVFPQTRIFSELARTSLDIDVNAIEDPDSTLMAWMNFEEKLFRRMERHLVSERIERGFTDDTAEGTDVDGFIRFSLSVQNRRKARVGQALEHHIEEILLRNQIIYDRGVFTENRSKPDFLFPGSSYYMNNSFSSDLLTMLGVKTTCKDRWRQVLSEAARINNKHLLTLEPSISINQTDEMRSHNLNLVLPNEIHSSYLPAQQSWLMTVKEFISLVGDKQNAAGLSFAF